VCAAGILTAACGGSDDKDDTSSSCTTNIATNHGHSMSVSAADKMAGVDKTYDITGSAAHSHTVELTADDFADLAAGRPVVVQSSTDANHSHDVTVSC